MWIVSSQSRRFSKQVEDFCQIMLKKSSVFSQDECQELIGSLIQTLVAMENHLKDSQEAELEVLYSGVSVFGRSVFAKFPPLTQKEITLTVHPFVQRIQQKLLWWEELTGLLQSQPALLQQEVSLRQRLIATLLEQLTSDNVLAFSDMEKILSEVQATLTEGLQLCAEGKKQMWKVKK